jgi:hypothetical protein
LAQTFKLRDRSPGLCCFPGSKLVVALTLCACSGSAGQEVASPSAATAGVGMATIVQIVRMATTDPMIAPLIAFGVKNLLSTGGGLRLVL